MLHYRADIPDVMRKHAWLNTVQGLNKMVEAKICEGGYVKYDVFVMR